MRPTSFTVLEAHEDEKGQLHIWADVNGHEQQLFLAKGTIKDRKLRYGLSHIEHATSGARVVSTLVDDVPDADTKALRLVFAEMCDRWGNNDLSKQVPGGRPDATDRADFGMKPRTDLHGHHPIVAKTPPLGKRDIRRKKP